MLDFILERESCWERLEHSDKPIVLYGMGNGADKILDWCETKGIKVSGVFASDEFVRYQSFRGFTVVKYQDLLDKLGTELLVVIAFASELSPVLDRFKALSLEQECLAPHMSLFEEAETVSLSWLEKHELELQRVYEGLADDWSRKVFANTLNYKLSGKIQYLFDCESKREQDIKEILKLQAGESYYDLGAYNGDTVKEFLALTGDAGGFMVAVEPDRRNCRKLRLLAEELGQDKLQVVEKGIWNVSGELGFSDSGGRQSTFVGAAKKLVEVISIDELGRQFSAMRPVGYIKMDLEGCEKQALEGGVDLLQEDRPKLFMAAYHYDEDLYELPLRLWQLVPGYKIYLRKHPYVPAWELNYLCVAE